MLLVFYAGILIAAGHGVAPLGFLLIQGNPEVWWAPQLFGWIGAIIEVANFFRLAAQNWWKVATVSLASLLISASLFVFNSDTLRYLDSDGPLLIPVLVIVVIRGAQIWLVKSSLPAGPE